MSQQTNSSSVPASGVEKQKALENETPVAPKAEDAPRQKEFQPVSPSYDFMKGLVRSPDDIQKEHFCYPIITAKESEGDNFELRDGEQRACSCGKMWRYDAGRAAAWREAESNSVGRASRSDDASSIPQNSGPVASGVEKWTAEATGSHYRGIPEWLISPADVQIIGRKSSIDGLLSAIRASLSLAEARAQEAEQRNKWLEAIHGGTAKELIAEFIEPLRARLAEAERKLEEKSEAVSS